MAVTAVSAVRVKKNLADLLVEKNKRKCIKCRLKRGSENLSAAFILTN
jgi:hypothetical protein